MEDGRGSLGQEKGGGETVWKTLRKSDGDRRAGDRVGHRAGWVRGARWDSLETWQRLQMLTSRAGKPQSREGRVWHMCGVPAAPQVGHMCGVPAADAL